MIVLQKAIVPLFTPSNEERSFIITLDESKSAGAQTYLIEFKNVVTNDIASVILDSEEDLSIAPYRYNEFLINSSVFDNVGAGQYNYLVTEISTNKILENGKMVLLPATEITKYGYTTATTIKGYAG